MNYTNYAIWFFVTFILPTFILLFLLAEDDKRKIRKWVIVAIVITLSGVVTFDIFV